MSIYDVFGGGNRPFDKVEWAAAKQAQRKEAYELIDNTCAEMAVGGDSFRQYLDVQGRFDRYPSTTPFWYRHRCQKHHSLRIRQVGNQTVSM